MEQTGVVIAANGTREDYAALLSKLEMNFTIEKDTATTAASSLILSSSEDIKTEVSTNIPQWVATLKDIDTKVINNQVEVAKLLVKLFMSFRPDAFDRSIVLADEIQRELKVVDEMTRMGGDDKVIDAIVA